MVAAVATLCSMVSAEPEKQHEPVDWEKHRYDVDEYFKGIPDYINMNATADAFRLIHGFLLGFQ